MRDNPGVVFSPHGQTECVPLQEFVDDEVPENFAYRCPQCCKVVFVAESDCYPLESLFLPVLQDRPVEAVLAEREYRLARFEKGVVLEWAVYVSRDAEIVVFKDTEHRWERIYSPTKKKPGRRNTVCLRRKNSDEYSKTAVARVVNYAWRDLAERPWAVVEHRNDDLDDDIAENTKIGNRHSNAETKHELKRQGREPKRNWIDVKVRRQTKARLVEVTGKRGVKLDQVVDEVLNRYVDFRLAESRSEVR